MSGYLLLFIGRDTGLDNWLHLADGTVVVRGTGEDPLPLPGELIHVAVVPGEDVALHWLELPAGLAPAQASAAARLMAAELSMQPLEELHVAAGPDADGVRCVAIAPAIRMESWIAAARAAGRDPDLVLPEPLLIVPNEGAVLRFDKAPLPIFRGSSDGFSVEPELAAAALAGRTVETIGVPEFEAGLADALVAPAVNLRQGMFAKPRQWRLDRRLVRRLGLLVVAILLVGAAVQVAAMLRYTFAADKVEAEAAALAQRALPPGAGGSDPVRRLEQRVVSLNAGGAGFGVLATAMFDAIKVTPNAELAALIFEGGELRATIVADTPATLTALQTRLEGQGFQVQNGAASIRNGRQAIEMIVRGGPR